MEKFSQSLWRKVQNLQKQLQNLLESENLHPQSRSAKPDAQKFEPLLNPEKLEQLCDHLPQEMTAKMLSLFSRLSPFFQAGLLMTKLPDGQYGTLAAFEGGQFFPLTEDDTKLRFPIPDLKPSEVRLILDGRVRQVLSSFGWLKAKETQVLVFSPQTDLIILVTSEAPDPWLKTFMSELIKEVHAYFRTS